MFQYVFLAIDSVNFFLAFFFFFFLALSSVHRRIESNTRS